MNGIPFSWNPGHERGVGSFALPSLPTGSGSGATPIMPATSSVRRSRSSRPRVVWLPRRSSRTRCPNDLYNMDQAGVGSLNRRSYNLTTLGSTSTVPLGIDWRNARGAFMLNGNLYYGMNDGWLYKRTFDGTTLGAASLVAVDGLEVQPPSGFNIPGTTTRVPAFALGTSSDVADMTGMFYDNGRICYTVSKTGSASANNNKLYYRYFNPERRSSARACSLRARVAKV